MKSFEELNEKQKKRRLDYLRRERGTPYWETPGLKKKDAARRTKEYRARNRERLNAARREAKEHRKPQVIANRKARHDIRWPISTFGVTCRNARLNALKRKVPFAITTQFLKELYLSQGGLCAVTKHAFKRGVKGGPSMFTTSLDRIKPALGYVPGNVRFVLHAINALKSTGTDKDLQELLMALYQYTVTEHAKQLAKV